MSATTAISVHVAPDAAARVKELSLQRELEAMLEHTRQTVPHLYCIEVSRYDDPEGLDEPMVVITAWQYGPASEDISIHDKWGDWFVHTFPPSVCRYFGFSIRFQE
jgi:hypothetical protein